MRVSDCITLARTVMFNELFIKMDQAYAQCLELNQHERVWSKIQASLTCSPAIWFPFLQPIGASFSDALPEIKKWFIYIFYFSQVEIKYTVLQSCFSILTLSWRLFQVRKCDNRGTVFHCLIMYLFPF